MITVIKLGGRVQSDAAVIAAIADRWTDDPGSICVVHGGGDDVSALQRQLGTEPKFVSGRRVTTEEDLELVRMMLSGSANKRLVAALSAAGAAAAGISGEDGDLLLAEPIDLERFGRAGKPCAVNTKVLALLLEGGFLPVVSPVGTDRMSMRRGALNVNGDDAAGAIAAALQAELLLVADVAGVMDANRVLLGSVDDRQMEALVAEGTVNRGMHAKLEAGFAALAGGAVSARIAGLEAISDPTAGTFLTLTAGRT